MNEPTDIRPPSLGQKIVLWITLMSCAAQPVLAATPIVADPNAGSKKPSVEAAPNGVPVVQIVAPNSNGVSHNQYQQFNVESRGAILNNNQGIVQTQQAGYIAGNANLTSGTARIILNEVTSSKPSLLQGHLEVAGARAEVVIANPNGITCDGCGFINTSRSVLTTGSPVFGGDGSLNAFRVTGGQIRVDNAGLYGSSTDQLDLIARSVVVNGELWANQLNVITGANQVNYTDLRTRHIAGHGAAPAVSIDVGALGGMYANKIRLVGTEFGVGVVSAGTLSTQNGDFSIDSQGRITLNGNTSATGVLQLTAKDGVSHGGTTYGQQGMQIATQGDVQNIGILASGSDLSIHAASVQSSGVLGAGVQADSTVGNSGNLTITTAGQLTAHGQNVAGGHIRLAAAGINLVNSQTSANGNVQLAAQNGDLELTGSRTSASGELTLNATGTVNNDNGLTQADRITVATGRLSNRAGTLSQSGTADTRITVTGALDNAAGTLASNGNNLTVQAGSLINSQGQIAHAGTGQLTVTTGEQQNDQGQIASNGQVAVTASSLSNRSGQVLAVGNTNLQVSGTVDNQRGQLKSYDGDLTLTTQGALNNATGRIEANGTNSVMTVSASDIDNTGGRIANIGTGKTTINSSQRVANSNPGNVSSMGMMGGKGDVEINAVNLANAQAGQIVAGDRLTLKLSGTAQNNGSITAAGKLTLAANTISGIGQMSAAQDISLNVIGDFTNAAGNQIKANRNLDIAATGTLTNQGQLEAVNNLNLTAVHIDNQAGAGINANQTTLAATGTLTNAGRIEGNTVNTRANILANTGAIIGGDVTLTANTLTNDGASALIASTGNTNLWVRDTFTNQNGATVYSMGDLNIAASGQRDGHGRLQDRTATILNDASTLETDGSLEVAVTNLTNRRAVQISTTDLGMSTVNKSNVILWEWGCGPDSNGVMDCTNPWVNRQLNIRGQNTAPKVVTIDASNLSSNDATGKVLTLKTPLFFGDYQFHLFSDDNSTPQTKPWEWYAGTIYYESLTPINNGTQYQLSFYPGMGPGVLRPSDIRSAGMTDRGELWESWRHQQVHTQEERVTQLGADSKILAGNSIKVSLGGTLTNEQGQIAAGGQVDINGSTTASGDVTGSNVINRGYGLVRTTTSSGTSGYWTWAGNVPRATELIDPLSTQTTVIGSAASSITAGQSISINTGAVQNQTVFSTNVPAGGNGSTLDAGQNHGAPSGGITSAASQSAPAFKLPQNALYIRHTEPGARYLIETDPRFANYGNFISSDYMLSRLNLNPAQTEKRLGDGFYEQRLILDQITQLTGQRYLGQYTSAEDQFKALMDQGIAVAQQFSLTPGISLTAEQVAALTSDLVWMETRSVTLPDGSQQQVLAPVVYLARLHADDLKPNGALIAAEDITIKTSGTLTNSGTLRGNTLALQATDIINRGGSIDGSTQTLIVANRDIINESGTLNGGRVALLAGRDLLNTTQAIQLTDARGSNTLLGNRGNLASRSDLIIQTGRDLTINGANVNVSGDATLLAGRNLDIGTTEARGSASGGREGLSSSVTRTVNATSSLNATHLTLQSGGDTTLKGAALNASDSLSIQAQGDLKLQTVKDDQAQSYQTAGSNYRYSGSRRDETVVGSQLSAGNAIRLSASPTGESPKTAQRGNLLLESATLTTRNGQIALSATNNITVAETAERHESTYHLQESKKGFLSSKTTTIQDQSNGTTAIGSTLSGNSIAIATGNDLTVRGSNVVGTQDVTLNAGNNLSIEAAQNTRNETHAVTESKSDMLGGALTGFSFGAPGQSKTTTSNDALNQTQAQASTLSGNNITVQAGNDLTVRGSNVTARGDLSANAGRDLLIDTAQNTGNESHAYAESKTGFSASLMGGLSYGKSAQTQSNAGQITTQIASTLSGQNVTLSAERDATIRASNVLADQDITLQAGRNVNILSAANTQSSQTHAESNATSIGIVGGLSARFTNFSKTSAEQDGNGTVSSQSTSLLSANQGNLTVTAGLDEQHQGTGQGTLTTQGADLLAGQQISLTGNAIDLQAIANKSDSHSRSESKSFTIGSALAGALGSKLTEISDMVEQAQNTDNNRLKGALALKAGYDAYKLSGNMNGLDGEIGNLGNAATDPQTAASGDTSTGMGVSVSMNSSKSQSESTTHDTQVSGTNLQAKRIDIRATETDLHMAAAKLQAEDISLNAKRDILLEAAANTSDIKSSNSSSSVGAGVTLAVGQQTGISFQLSASQAKGKTNGSETVWDNTQITATNSLALKSGGNTTLKGAQLAGKQVDMEIGSSLLVQTLQDSSAFNSQQSSAGFSLSLCIPPICYGTMVNASLNLSKQSIKHNYLSAVGQSGIAAGEGGFNINVKGHTELIGAALTGSSDPTKNTLTTASLSSRDLQNAQSTESKSSSLSLSYSGASAMATLAANATQNLLGNLQGNGTLPKNGRESSTTLSVISPATITLTGSGDVAKDAQSQQTAALLTHRDARTANASLKNTLSLQQAQLLQDEIKKQQQDAEAANKIGAVMTNIIGDVAQKNDWKESSPQKLALHGIAGLIEAKIAGGNGNGNGTAGALAGLTHEAMVPVLSDYLIKNGFDFNEKGITPEEAGKRKNEYNSLMQLGSSMVGAVVGAAVGGDVKSASVGANVAYVADVNNRQLHEPEKYRIKQLAGDDKNKEARLTIAACAMVKCAAEYPPDSQEYKYFKQMEDLGSSAEFSQERSLLTSGTRKMFDYTAYDSLSDKTARINNTYQITTRLGGTARMVGGTAEVSAAVAASPSCATILGCLAVAAVATHGVSEIQTGAKQVASGKTEQSSVELLLQNVTGVSPEAASLLNNMIGFGGTIGTLRTAMTGGSATAKVAEGVESGGVNGAVNPTLLNELAANGVKFTPENVIASVRSPSGQVVFLETGNSRAGLQHIIGEHANDFANIGVSQAEIPGVVMQAVSQGKIVGYQGAGTGRPIFETVINGQSRRLAITIGNNGFIVGANPKGSIK